MYDPIVFNGMTYLQTREPLIEYHLNHLDAVQVYLYSYRSGKNCIKKLKSFSQTNSSFKLGLEHYKVMATGGEIAQRTLNIRCPKKSFVRALDDSMFEMLIKEDVMKKFTQTCTNKLDTGDREIGPDEGMFLEFRT